jgi:hypothetical protein
LADVRYPEARTLFSEHLVKRNGLGETGFETWAFYPGMLFGARSKWWGDRGPRSRPHEGIDLGLYADEAGGAYRLDASSRIPVMFDGEIFKIEEDFLGASVFVRHDVDDGQGRRLCSIYGHTKPANGVGVGRGLGQGEIIGTLRKVERGPTGVFAHLHLTVAWVSTAFALDALNWERLNDPDVATLLDPLRVMNCRHTTLNPDARPK